jgi:AraC-like DNA-binding protein
MSKTRQPPHVRTLAWDYASGEHIPAHTHDWAQLVYASAGVMTIHTPDGTWVLPAHRAVWVPANVVHAIEISGRVSMRTLYVAPRVARALPRGCAVLSVSPLLRELILHVVELGGLDRRRPAQARLLAVLLDCVRVLPSSPLELPQLRDRRAVRVALAMRDDPSAPLAAVVRGAGASLRTIERLFRAETGMTLGRFHQQLRLVHALRLLADGQPVTAVALDVGYDSPSAFVSAFRRTFGSTPGRYFRGA